MTTTPPGPVCTRGDVVLVLFPNSNLRTAKLRPALVVDFHLLNQNAALRSGMRSFGNLLVTDESVGCDEECCC